MDLTQKLAEIKALLDSIPKNQTHFYKLLYSVQKNSCDIILRIESMIELMDEQGESVNADYLERVKNSRAFAEATLAKLHNDLRIKLSHYLNQ